MPQGSPTLGRGQVDVIRLEPLGKFKQTQNGNVRGQGKFMLRNTTVSNLPQPVCTSPNTTHTEQEPRLDT